MYKIIIYAEISKESLYCLLIQFSPIKSIKYKKYFVIEYFNKKDMKYSLEMIGEIKLFDKYIKYKILDDKCVYIVPDTTYLEVFDKFKCKKVDQKIIFESEEKMKEVIKIIEEEYVNYKKIKYKIFI
ncbi:hypothetical protein AAJ76_3900023220 [Vairimorpha ceranae]|uniref:Uncharacterized protein n=1 Tax=Vairimorpha ceranae TaxID=40302 RepID=A0A0F9WPP6_9MICR|nr:hypothetical protein AAJ76_3900023220 [Vairimorpha ceranae]KAF5139850.1 hypothetical protein G9O61_00g020200 [Vairimorpha ceranae]KKO74918.1 hypothetical protein AAJ76_3900023220 [Vairimorpha ceranae]